MTMIHTTREWNRRRFLQAGLLGAAASMVSTRSPAAETKGVHDAEVIQIGGDRQLFLDDRLLDLAQSRDVTRTLNSPESIRRVLTPDQPWEALGFIFYCSVVDD